jgi:hypothetical protein
MPYGLLCCSALVNPKAISGFGQSCLLAYEINVSDFRWEGRNEEHRYSARQNYRKQKYLLYLQAGSPRKRNSITFTVRCVETEAAYAACTPPLLAVGGKKKKIDEWECEWQTNECVVWKNSRGYILLGPQLTPKSTTILKLLFY